VRLSLSADPFSSLQLAIKLFAFIVAGMLLMRYARDEKRLRLLIYTVIGVGLASALFGVMRQGTATGEFLPLPNEARGFAQFVNRNHFAFLTEMALGLTLGMLVVCARNYLKFAIFLAIGIFLWVVLILSNSRGGIFASLCQVLFLVLLFDPLKRLRSESLKGSRLLQASGGFAMKMILILLLVGVFAYGVSWVGGESVVSNFELSSYSFSQQGGQDKRENISRKHIWAATWELIKARPIVGAGFGAYWIAITKYHNASGSYTPQEAHNDYLELLASGGILGAAIVVWFAGSYVKRIREGFKNLHVFQRASTLGALTGLFGVIVHSFVDFGLHITVNAVVFSVLIAIPLIASRLSCEQSGLLDSRRSLR
jgi:O-antigen ligase